MGRYTRYVGLPDQAYDPRITDLDNPFNVPAATGPQSIQPGDVVTGVDAAGMPQFKRAGQWVNRNIANTFPFGLVAGAPVRALPANPKRTGLIIQNKDATNTMFFAFGNQADVNSGQIGAGGSVLLDFTTPSTELYLFSPLPNNVQCTVIEMVRV